MIGWGEEWKEKLLGGLEKMKEEREKGETMEERRVEECVLLSLQPQSYIT